MSTVVFDGAAEFTNSSAKVPSHGTTQHPKDLANTGVCLWERKGERDEGIQRERKRKRQ